MELTGKIIAVLPERGGTSARTGSEWKLGTYVLETMDQYPRKMCFEVFGADRIQQFNIQLGEILTVSFDIDAHEYQGRWFNDVRAYNIIRGQVPPVAGAPVAGSTPFPPAPGAAAPADATPFPPAPEAAAEGSADDLPF